MSNILGSLGVSLRHDSILLATGGGEDITVWSFKGNGPEVQHRGIRVRGTNKLTCILTSTQATGIWVPRRWSVVFGKKAVGAGWVALQLMEL